MFGILKEIGRPLRSAFFVTAAVQAITKEGQNMEGMDFKQLAGAIKAIAEEKNLPEDAVKEVVEQALAAAYRRDYGEREQEVRVTMNLNTGDVDAFVMK